MSKQTNQNFVINPEETYGDDVNVDYLHDSDQWVVRTWGGDVLGYINPSDTDNLMEAAYQVVSDYFTPPERFR